MTTYVLIPGACHGAWCFDDPPRLPAWEPYREHATGVQSERTVDGGELETTSRTCWRMAAHHVEDAVLVGHSYGGMVITGVADRIPEKVDALVTSTRARAPGRRSCWHLVNDDEL